MRITPASCLEVDAGWGYYLFGNLWSSHLLEVFQVGVEQVAAGQTDAEDWLDDVADGTVIGKSDLLRRVHKVTSTGKKTNTSNVTKVKL